MFKFTNVTRLNFLVGVTPHPGTEIKTVEGRIKLIYGEKALGRNDSGVISVL